MDINYLEELDIQRLFKVEDNPYNDFKDRKLDNLKSNFKEFQELYEKPKYDNFQEYFEDMIDLNSIEYAPTFYDDFVLSNEYIENIDSEYYDRNLLNYTL